MIVSNLLVEQYDPIHWSRSFEGVGEIQMELKYFFLTFSSALP